MLVKEEKAALRKRAKTVRAAALAKYGYMAGRSMAMGGLDFVTIRYGCVVACFSPMPDEIDPLALFLKLNSDGFKLALPQMQGKGLPLVMRAWTPGDRLIAGTWGIKEPGPEAPVVEPEVVFVPLLAFDRQGYRLGYGGGFYDRTLELLRARNPKLVTIGLGFAEQEIDAVPHDVHDQRLDWVLTPSGPVKCQR